MLEGLVRICMRQDSSPPNHGGASLVIDRGKDPRTSVREEGQLMCKI